MKALSKRSPRIKSKWTGFKAQIPGQPHILAHFIFLIGLVDDTSSTQPFFSFQMIQMTRRVDDDFSTSFKGLSKNHGKGFLCLKTEFLNFYF
jgi:hypothetical protein